MSRKCLEHMLDELEFSTFSNYQKWYSNQGHICYNLPELNRDFRSIRRNQHDFYPNDYNRQLYWMPQSFLPTYEPFHFLRWNDKRYIPNKVYQYTREKRNFRENKFYQNREEKETNLRVDRVRRDFISQFERRFQSSWDHSGTAPSYQMSRDDRNPARLSFRNSINDLCAEDSMVDQCMNPYKQAFDSRNSTEHLALKEDARQTSVCENKYADSYVGVNYSDSSAVEWQEKGTKISNTIPSDSASYVTASDFSSSYESWYCPEEQQQIVDMLKEVNLRHDRQLQRDKLVSSEEPLCSNESISSNNDSNIFEKSLSSDDEVGINIILSPKGEAPIPKATNNGESELKCEYFEKSSSELFEEFQNIFTGSPEKQIFNKFTKESMKKTVNVNAESIDYTKLDSTITNEDKNTVKSVLTFDNLDDLPEKTLENFADATYFSTKGESSEDSSTQKLTSRSEEENKSCRTKLATTTNSGQLPLKENAKPYITEIPILTLDITQNTTEKNHFNEFQGLDETSQHKCNFLPKEKISSEQTKNTEKVLNDINHEFEKALEGSNFRHSDNHLLGLIKHVNKPKQISPSKDLSNIKYCSKAIHHSSNRFRHKLKPQSSYCEKAAEKYCPPGNMNNSVMLNSFNKKSLNAFQSDISSNPKYNYTINYKDSSKTYNTFNVQNKRPKVNPNEKSEKNNFSSSDPSLHCEREKAIYKRISVSEIFKNSIVNSSREMEILEKRQTHVRQFIKQSEYQTSLSPSEHLKLILGIDSRAKDLNTDNNVQTHSSVNNTTNSNQLPAEISMLKLSDMLDFKSSESDRNKTGYFTNQLYESMSHKYPCCKSFGTGEGIVNELVKNKEERVKNYLNNINLCSAIMSLPTYKTKANMEIKPEGIGECEFVGSRKMVHGCKTCKMNDCFERNPSHDSNMTDACEAITDDYKFNHLHSEYNDVNNILSKLESMKGFNNQKQTLVKFDTELSERSSKSFNYGLVNQSKRNYFEEGIRGSLIGDENKMNYFVEKKAKRYEQHCPPSFDFNPSQVITEKIVNDSNAKTKSVSVSPTTNKKFKKKKKKETCLEKYKMEKYVSKAYRSDGRLPFNKQAKQSQISDIFPMNDSKEIPQTADGHVWNMKSPDASIIDQLKANFTNIIDNKLNTSIITKNAEMILSSEKDKVTREKNQMDEQGTILELWNLPNNNYRKINEIQNKSRTCEEKIKAFKTTLKNSKAKGYNFTTKHEFNEADEKHIEKVKCNKNEIFNFNHHGTSDKEVQFLFNDSPYENAPTEIMTGSFKYLSRSFNKINKGEINTIISEDNGIITGKYLEDESQLHREGNEAHNKTVSIMKTETLPVGDISVGNKEVQISYLKHNEKDKNCEHSKPTKTANRKKAKGTNIQNIVISQTKLLNFVFVLCIPNLRDGLKRQVGEGKNGNSFEGLNSCVSFYNENQVKTEKRENFNLSISNTKGNSLSKLSKNRNFETVVCNNRVHIEIDSMHHLSNYAKKSVILHLLEIFCNCNTNGSFQLCFYKQDKYKENEKQHAERLYSIIFKLKSFKLENAINQMQENKKVIAFITPEYFYFYLRNKQVLIFTSKISPFPIFHIQIPLQNILSQMKTNQLPINFKCSLQLSLNSLITGNLIQVVPLLLRFPSILSALNIPCYQKYLKEVLDLAYPEKDNKRDENKILATENFREECVSDALRTLRILRY